jgi:hypothetical protein
MILGVNLKGQLKFSNQKPELAKDGLRHGKIYNRRTIQGWRPSIAQENYPVPVHLHIVVGSCG